MKHKLIILALVISLVFVSQNTLSLGMGKIQVNSALDESLDATINIIANDNESIDQVSVKLASAADYKKVGLDKSFVPGNIMVSVDSDNPYQINVSSNGPVSEPIVSLLLDVSWANGRILREFTLLLDPPSYQSSNQGTVNIPTAQPPASKPVVETMADQEEDVMASQNDDSLTVTKDLNEAYEAMDTSATDSMADDAFTVETPMEENVSETIVTGPGEVYVAAGDTLWRIANQNKPSDVSIHQMMMAIYKNNPDAFLNNNINQMIKGSTLQMPGAERADDISSGEALAEFESHNSRWSGNEDNYSSFQTESQFDDSQAQADSIDYGVQLSGGEGDDMDSQQTEGDVADTGNSGLSDEEAYNIASEKDELKSRVSELESIVGEQQAALELQDDDLANLENQMGQDPLVSDEQAMIDGDFEDESTSVDADDAVTDDVWGSDLTDTLEDSADEAMTMTEGQDDMSTTDVSDSEEVTSDVDKASEKATMTTSPTPVKVSEPWYASAIDWVKDNVLWVIIGFVVLFLLVLIPRFLNREDQDSLEEGSFLDDIKSSRDEQNEVSEDEESELTEDDVDELMLTTPIVADDDNDGDDDFSSLNDNEAADDDDVLADLDSSLAFDDRDEDDSDDDFEFNFDDETPADNSDKDGQSEASDVDDDLVELDNETATKEFDPAPFRDDDSFEDDFDLSELDTDDSEDLKADEVTGQSLADEDVIDLESELSALDDDLDETHSDTEKAQDDDFLDNDFLAELDDIEDLDDEGLDDVDEKPLSDSLDNLDSEDDDEFEDALSLDEDDQATVFETDNGEDDMDDDTIDLGLDDLMDDGDVIETKLDLAKAYIEMGDTEGAKNLLDEVKAEGNEAQQSEANKLIDDM